MRRVEVVDVGEVGGEDLAADEAEDELDRLVQVGRAAPAARRSTGGTTVLRTRSYSAPDWIAGRRQAA
jgi:hypothetical protein